MYLTNSIYKSTIYSLNILFIGSSVLSFPSLILPLLYLHLFWRYQYCSLLWQYKLQGWSHFPYDNKKWSRCQLPHFTSVFFKQLTHRCVLYVVCVRFCHNLQVCFDTYGKSSRPAWFYVKCVSVQTTRYLSMVSLPYLDTILFWFPFSSWIISIFDLVTIYPDFFDLFRIFS